MPGPASLTGAVAPARTVYWAGPPFKSPSGFWQYERFQGAQPMGLCAGGFEDEAAQRDADAWEAGAKKATGG